MKFKEYRQHQIMLMPASLDDKVPQDHLARYIDKVVDQLNIKEIEDSYSDLGCHAYHPQMLIKVILYGYCIGIRSSRRIQKEIQEDLVFMWLAGQQEPDFRTISDFRKDRIKDIKQLFNQVLVICYELGMVQCGKISIDGTKIEANSGRNKITYRKKLEKDKASYERKIDEILQEAEDIDAEEDRLYGDKDGYSLDRGYTSEEIKGAMKRAREKAKLGRHKEKAQEKLAVVNKKLERMGEDRNSFGNTDKDATLMLMKNKSLGVGYNVQMATENQVIVGFGVFQDRADTHLLQPMIAEVEHNLGMTPEVIMADKGYCSEKNYEYLACRGMKGAIPPHTFDIDIAARHKGTYQPSNNPTYEQYKVDMLNFLETDEGKGLMDKRKWDVEPTFGDIKHNMGFRKFLLRLMPKVNTELGLISIAHNIKKIKTWRGMPQLVEKYC
jgi:Transposase and inactivated derivatives